MPEGPSIVILKEECALFKEQKIIHVTGNSKVGIERLKNQKVIDFKSFVKNLFICFKSFSVRIHLMLFGSYRINVAKEAPPRLSLQFSNGQLNFYSCVVQIIDENLNKLYDWELDVMSNKWNPDKVRDLLNGVPDSFVCDALLDQHIFAGVGNIIKNEVLFRVKIHPLTKIKALPSKKLKALLKQARQYSFDFYAWKKKFELKKHWLVHRRKICPACGRSLNSVILGKTKRRTYFCAHCQNLYR